VPLLGRAEKAQLEELILKKLKRTTTPTCVGSLLVDGLRVIVTVDGPALDSGEQADPLAAVQIRTLFTALCYTDRRTPAMPRETLETLATEATSASRADQPHRPGLSGRDGNREMVGRSLAAFGTRARR
jgi:hypothetical protein